mmetsp:Transcript_30010/g.73862  ORF Transcript_30010/g.73862 Transcript_30010/m.73862 type:complete len:86 (-) Transcript_30010:98-355(-)|eukprot:3561341-Prymnesium_polylepis.2
MLCASVLSIHAEPLTFVGGLHMVKGWESAVHTSFVSLSREFSSLAALALCGVCTTGGKVCVGNGLELCTDPHAFHLLCCRGGNAI